MTVSHRQKRWKSDLMFDCEHKRMHACVMTRMGRAMARSRDRKRAQGEGEGRVCKMGLEWELEKRSSIAARGVRWARRWRGWQTVGEAGIEEGRGVV